MSPSIIPFDFQDDRIRVLSIDGEPWFVAKDICVVLGYQNTRDAIGKHCKGGSESRLPSTSGDQQYTIIPERDVYRLIMRSRLPSAQRFEDWVVGVVLPAIRKTGGYSHQAKELESKVRQLQQQLSRLRSGVTPRIRVTGATREKANQLTDRLRETEPNTTRMEAIEWALNQAFASIPASRQTTLELGATA